MLFNSLTFLIFAPVFYLLYFVLRGRARLGWCVLASYFFYAWWDWRFVGLLAGSTLVAFFSARLIARSNSTIGKKFWLWFCILTHLFALVFFKYFNFLADSLKTVFHWLGYSVAYENPGILLPIGISFFTFTALSYIIDVYRGKINPYASTLLEFGTYECLFPHLVAGPILRASTFLPQLKIDYAFDWSRTGRGLEMIAWGYLLKLGLADNASLFAEPRFTNPELFTSASLIMGVLTFALQIYGDFAGYSLIAIGLARIMGYDFGINFNKPYFASSFSDFWQRWHISLSSWIRDYVYIPLGGSRQGAARTAANLMRTMFVAGLWHGAGWNYAIWGLLHGAFLVGQRMIGSPYENACHRLHCPKVAADLIATITVFSLTCIAWIFFRAHTLDQSLYIIRALFSWDATAHLSFGGMKFQLLRIAILALIVFSVDLAGSFERARSLYMNSPYVRALAVGLTVICTLFLGNFASNSFIYFQF